jgi:hypothetical protein
MLGWVWLAQNWKWVASAAGSFAATASFGIWLHVLIMDGAALAHEKQLWAQDAELRGKCRDAIKSTEDNNADFQTNYNDLFDKHDDTVRALGLCRQSIKLHSSAPDTGQPGVGATGKLLHNDAADIGDLLDFARKAETVRLQLLSCHKAVDKIYEMNDR